MCREEVASALNTGTKDSGASPNRVIVLCFYGKTLSLMVPLFTLG